MSDLFEHLPFRPADILLPQGCDMELWSVVACDQYTSQPEYWQRVEERVGRAPSTLRLILPESCLEGPNVETDIMEINNTMGRYLRDGLFRTYPDCLIYVERTLSSGAVRHGLVGMVDLEQYDYEPGASSLVRATEGTVLSRIPPRVAVRKNAPIELPHVMMLADDREKRVIEPLADQTDGMELLYDFELMEQGGHIRGWALTQEQKDQVALALASLADPASFRERYQLGEEPVLLFAVGDGNHSLATAKECYERQKRLTPPEQWATLPARYALCELVNLHDSSLEFEPIHRVVFDVKPEELLAELRATRDAGKLSGGNGPAHPLLYAYRGANGTGERGCIHVNHPAAQLPVGTLQNFLDDFLLAHPGTRIDYIHGGDVALRLAEERSDAVAFLLPEMGKEELFPTVIHDGVLPRKTFSMGEAQDKRFYLEARRIRD
ncbi:DUF1015 domain-containing protein [Flavonifractor sp. An100]|uniref:DUF1015 domain-containing protein n=1 Tax=Flavonifractor sp. An100 TaxID=1965538 RepID=UPI000B394AE4|nr:DUF1015 domain-containing protein [Flavonifractor sp. An100]OUQ81028.1 hypothetical protein B5E43_02550 [Flavonifractor sp. An100]